MCFLFFCASVVLSPETFLLHSTKYEVEHVKSFAIHHHVENQTAENNEKTPIQTLKYDGDH